MSYAEELKTTYRGARQRLWSGRFPSDGPRRAHVEKPMEYSGKASGNLWWGISPERLEGATVKGRDIIRAVEHATKVKHMDLLSSRRWKSWCEARQIACWFMRYYTPLTYPNIGRILGDRDQSTVRHAIKLINSQPERFRERIEAVAAVLGVDLPDEAVPFR